MKNITKKSMAGQQYNHSAEFKKNSILQIKMKQFSQHTLSYSVTTGEKQINISTFLQKIIL